MSVAKGVALGIKALRFGDGGGVARGGGEGKVEVTAGEGRCVRERVGQTHMEVVRNTQEIVVQTDVQLCQTSGLKLKGNCQAEKIAHVLR